MHPQQIGKVTAPRGSTGAGIETKHLGTDTNS